jgi:hypothetical protein
LWSCQHAEQVTVGFPGEEGGHVYRGQFGRRATREKR